MDYMPTMDGAFHPWYKNFCDRIIADPARYGVLPADLADLQAGGATPAVLADKTLAMALAAGPATHPPARVERADTPSAATVPITVLLAAVAAAPRAREVRAAVVHTPVLLEVSVLVVLPAMAPSATVLAVDTTAAVVVLKTLVSTAAAAVVVHPGLPARAQPIQPAISPATARLLFPTDNRRAPISHL